MSQAEVGGVVTEEYAEPSRAVFSDPATNDDAAQCDRLAITTLQTQQARTVTAGISARQVWPAYLGSPSAPPAPSWTTAQDGGPACAVAVRGVR